MVCKPGLSCSYRFIIQPPSPWLVLSDIWLPSSSWSVWLYSHLTCLIFCCFCLSICYWWLVSCHQCSPREIHQDHSGWDPLRHQTDNSHSHLPAAAWDAMWGICLFLLVQLSQFCLINWVVSPPLPTTGAFDLLVYTDKDLVVPDKWEESGPQIIDQSEEVRLRSFTTSIHKVNSMVAYKKTDSVWITGAVQTIEPLSVRSSVWSAQKICFPLLCSL